MPDSIASPADSSDVKTGISNPKARRWGQRVESADRAYKIWESDYMCEFLEKYYLGHQWKEAVPGSHYTINLCYPTVETKIPSMMFFRPKLHITPKVARSDDPGSNLDDRAQLLEDTAQTFLASDDAGAMESANLALKESFYRFGVVEVVYSMDFSDNPNADRPLLKEDGSEIKDSDGKPVMAPPIVPVADNLYVKWIPASTFRVGSTNSHPTTRFNDWIGYYEWQYKEDILRNKAYKNRAQVKSSGSLSTKYFNPAYAATDPDDKKRYEMVKVWKIWDLRGKVRHVWPEGGDKFFVEDEPWTTTPSGKPFHPFAFIRRHSILNSWYPLPPMFNWISPQDELNETRDMQKVHRKRAYRRNLVQKGSIDPAELSKLESGGDMVHAEVNRLDCIRPMEDAPLDRAVTLNVPTTKEDFLNVSGIGGDRRGVAEAETATQASIIDTNAKIRDSFERQQIGKFMGELAWLILETIRARFTLPMVVQVNVDPQGPYAINEAMRVAGLWKQITSPDLGDFEFEVAVDVESLSPVTEDQMRAQWTQILGLFQNPTLLIALLSSKTLLRKTLGLYGIRTDKEVGEISLAMQATLQALVGMQGGGGKGSPANASGAGASSPSGLPMPAPGAPPPLEDISEQLGAQGVGPSPIPQ